MATLKITITLRKGQVDEIRALASQHGFNSSRWTGCHGGGNPSGTVWKPEMSLVERYELSSLRIWA